MLVCEVVRAVPSLLGAPREVYFFIIDEKLLVKTAQQLKYIPTNKVKGTDNLFYVATRGVIPLLHQVRPHQPRHYSVEEKERSYRPSWRRVPRTGARDRSRVIKQLNSCNPDLLIRWVVHERKDVLQSGLLDTRIRI